MYEISFEKRNRNIRCRHKETGCVGGRRKNHKSRRGAFTARCQGGGCIDGHTHFDLEVAGTVTADDFETGTRAAILGGTTLVIDFASQDKGGHTLKEGLEKWHKKADGKCSCDYSFHMSIVEWNEETKKEIQDMINEGITSFKLYMTYPA